MSLHYICHRVYCSSPRWYMSMDSHGGMILTGENRRTWRQPCPNATLPTRLLKWTDQGTNPGLRGKKPPTNRLSHGTTKLMSPDERNSVLGRGKVTFLDHYIRVWTGYINTVNSTELSMFLQGTARPRFTDEEDGPQTWWQLRIYWSRWRQTRGDAPGF
jgi:hypothetical protein